MTTEQDQLKSIADTLDAIVDLVSRDEWGEAMDKVDTLDALGEGIDRYYAGELHQLCGDFWAHNLGTQRVRLDDTVAATRALARRMRVGQGRGLRNYYVTFGQKYHREEHPVILDGVRPHPDGWVLIRCGNQTIAERTAHGLFGTRFSLVYSEETHRKDYYPLGELFSITIEENR